MEKTIKLEPARRDSTAHRAADGEEYLRRGRRQPIEAVDLIHTVISRDAFLPGVGATQGLAISWSRARQHREGRRPVFGVFRHERAA